MKTKKLFILSLLALLAFEFSNAHTARVQVIHNSADMAADTVDVYLNDGLLLDDFAFRTASPFVDAPAGTPIEIDIAPANSTSSADSIWGLTTTLTEGETYTLIANGIISGGGYSPSPAFGIDVYAMSMESSMKTDTTAVLVYHGSTDAPTVDIYEAAAGELVDDVSYNDFSSGYLNLPEADYILEVRTDDGSSIVARYAAPLETLNLGDSAITVLASGFLDPSVNSSGPAFGLFVALPEGGELIPLDAPETVFDVAINSTAHDTLEAAITAANLGGALSGDGPFTVFAPTDDAFKQLPDGTLDALLADPTGDLSDILLYHVVSGEVLSGALTDGMKVATLQGDSLMVNVDGTDVYINGAMVTTPDIGADNGVVHVIDSVLLPPLPETVVDIVVESEAHTTLETAVVEAELAG
ncbi:MAG: DUF4397 domain-containing protein, partial [Bacteroidetes bacterium]|nr:DUF4397 domain-containing protein [Bacteroidota bacterium]